MVFKKRKRYQSLNDFLINCQTYKFCKESYNYNIEIDVLYNASQEFNRVIQNDINNSIL